MQQIDIKILDRDYRLAFSEGEQRQLLDTVRLVDGRMRAIRDAGKISGIERIAVMAALQLAHELLSSGTPVAEASAAAMKQRIRRIGDDIEAEVLRQEKLF